jgi:Xaa-Pro aminopeptidase
MNRLTSRNQAYLTARQQSVIDAMGQRKLDGLLITHPPDLAWLSDFTGHDSIGLLTAKEFYLVTDFRYTEQADKEAGWMKQIIRQAKMADALVDAIGQSGAKRIGFEANFTQYGLIDGLGKAIQKSKLGSTVELVALEDVLVNLRKVKDDREIGIIRQSIGVAQEAYKALLGLIKVGQTESHLAGLLLLEMRKRGASDASFPPIVGAGANSSLPHYSPQDTKVMSDQFLLIDWGALFKGYCSDLTRTLLIGRVPAALEDIYKITLEAQLAAIALIKPGASTQAVDKAARDVIERAGFGDKFGHGLGHGIGRDIHELPTLRKTPPAEELRPGMVVTVEPGIYLPGQGGVRIEDDVLVTTTGAEVLSSLDKSLDGNRLK